MGCKIYCKIYKIFHQYFLSSYIGTLVCCPFGKKTSLKQNQTFFQLDFSQYTFLKYTQIGHQWSDMKVPDWCLIDVDQRVFTIEVDIPHLHHRELKPDVMAYHIIPFFLFCLAPRRGLLWTTLIARFLGPTWGPSGADGTQGGPCWPHELCYSGVYILFTHMYLLTVSV